MNIFRHYTNTGSTANKKTIRKQDDLEKIAIKELLLREFGLKVDMNFSQSQEADIVEKIIHHITPWKYTLHATVGIKIIHLMK